MKFHEVTQHGVSTGFKAIGQIKWIPLHVPEAAAWMANLGYVPGEARTELITNVDPRGFGTISFGEDRRTVTWDIVESAEVWYW